jgi:hypothetical protein
MNSGSHYAMGNQQPSDEGEGFHGDHFFFPLKNRRDQYETGGPRDTKLFEFI